MSNNTPQKLGFIGLGQMGAPMATNIANGGFDLSVYDQAGTQEHAASHGSTHADDKFSAAGRAGSGSHGPGAAGKAGCKNQHGADQMKT